MKDHAAKVWPFIAGATLLLPLLFSGLSWWPEVASNLRYPLLALSTLTAIAFSFSPGLRARARAFVYSPDTLIPPIHEIKFAVGIFAYFFIFFAKVFLQQYRSFTLNAFDFSSYDFIFANTARGLTWETLEGVNYFGLHASPILFLIYPLHRLFSHPLFLHLFYGFCLWASAIPLYLLFRRNLTVPLHRLLLLFAFFNFGLFARVVNAGFHVEGLYVPLLFLWFLFLQDQKWTAFSVVAILLLGVKEDSAIYLIGASLGLFFFENYAVPRRVPITLLVVSAAVSVFDTQWMFPYYFSAGKSPLAELPSAYGANALEIARRLPQKWSMLLPDYFANLGTSLTGFIFVPLLVPFTFFSIVPILFLVSLKPGGLLAFRSAPLIPFLFFGYLLYLCQPNLPGTRKPFWQPLKNGIVVFTFLLLCLVGRDFCSVRPTHPDDTWVSAVRAEMDPKHSVCAQASLIPHLGYPAQMRALNLGCVSRQAGEYLLQGGVSPYPLAAADWNQIYQSLDRNPLYLKRRFGTITLFRKRG